MLRVTSGTAKNKRLNLPKGQKLTAVKEVVKLAIFSSLAEKVKDADCLDLYAGSGSLGIEALSRGAFSCDFVDVSKSATETIAKNLRLTSLTDRARVFRADALSYLANENKVYDLIFADPYYDELNHRHLFKLAIDRLKPGGTFVLLTSSKLMPTPTINEYLHCDLKTYGKTAVLMLTNTLKSF